LRVQAVATVRLFAVTNEVYGCLRGGERQQRKAGKKADGLHIEEFRDEICDLIMETLGFACFIYILLARPMSHTTVLRAEVRMRGISQQ
jgi:hypothetical protein